MENLKKLVSDFLADQGFTDIQFGFYDKEDLTVCFGTTEDGKADHLSLGSHFFKGIELDVTSKLNGYLGLDIDDDVNVYIIVKLYDENDFHRDM